MPSHIRACDNANRAIVHDDPGLPHVHFNLLRLQPGENLEQALPEHESVLVVLSGTVDIIVDGERFAAVGKRADIWSGEADSVYAPRGASVRLENATGPTEIAVAGGLCDEAGLKPFRIAPEEVAMVDVGSPDTHSRRRIFHILGQNGKGAPAISWSASSMPIPAAGPAIRRTSTIPIALARPPMMSSTTTAISRARASAPRLSMSTASRTASWSSMAIRCWSMPAIHPTVTSPGHRCYIFTILVGKTQRGLVQHFDERHAHLMAAIPGIQSMRDKFK
jgi:5-deoxy-glucuronate isomerase